MKGKLVFGFIFLLIFTSVGSYGQAFDKANSPINVTVSSHESSPHLSRIYWTAAENGNGYSLFYQFEGSNVIFSLSLSINWVYPNSYNSDWINRNSFTSAANRVRFGVRTNNKVDSGGRTSGPSDIVWTTYINIR